MAFITTTQLPVEILLRILQYLFVSQLGEGGTLLLDRLYVSNAICLMIRIGKPMKKTHIISDSGREYREWPVF